MAMVSIRILSSRAACTLVDVPDYNSKHGFDLSIIAACVCASQSLGPDLLLSLLSGNLDAATGLQCSTDKPTRRLLSLYKA